MCAVPPAEDRLESWKEIAAYLKRGVRTVRRWEHDEGLPVHRHQHKALGSVYAFKSEIDAWRQSGSRAPMPSAAPLRPKSIVVLPFANLSDDPNDEYFADGLTDEVIADLSTIRALRVISRTSSMALKHSTRNLRAIATDLRVAFVLEGTVRRSGNRLRVIAQLIDAAADDHVWSGKLDSTLEDAFTVQEQLARQIVAALRLRLTSDEERRLSPHPITDAHAYECYLRARHEAWRWHKDAIDHAVHLLRTGIDVIGDNPRLYAALGFAQLQYREAAIDVSERPLAEAEACARRVFALDSGSIEGLRLQAWIHYARGRIADAVADLAATIVADPNNADALLLLSNCYLISGRVARARILIDRLLSLDPLTPLTRCMPAFADILEGRGAAAIEPYRQMFEMDRDNPMARLFYAWVLMINQRPAGFEGLIRTLPAHQRDTVPGQIARFLGHASSRNEAAAVALITPELESRASVTDVFPRFLAGGYALLGQYDNAMHWLMTAVERGFINYPFLNAHDPLLAELRSRPAFTRLMDDVRRRWNAFPA
jgi:non-specific serine/threonine protein kinase